MHLKVTCTSAMKRKIKRLVLATIQLYEIKGVHVKSVGELRGLIKLDMN
jgi:hypothetical protein